MTLRILLASLVLSVTTSAFPAQSKPTPALAFEVATIKPSDPEKVGGSLMMSEGHFETRGQTLGALIKFAYGLTMGTDQQLSGGPKWMSTEKFDIDAKEDEQTAAALKAMPREESTRTVRQMVAVLLADRFGLVVHKESKVLPVYALVVAKGGSKMTLSEDTPPNSGAKDPRTWSGIRGGGRGQLEAHNCTMGMFSGVVAGQPESGGRLVVDQTNLLGKYNFTLKWTPESSSGAPDPVAAAESTAPPFLTALQEQLGLKLEPTHAPVDTIVVDAAVMPTAN
jgi:uncharacterized protein (TIGR03435 family)